MNGKTTGTPKVMRQWSNTISGWFLACVVMFVIIGASDPLGVHSQWSEPGQGADAVNLAIVAWFALVSIGGFALFGRPRVEIDSEKITLRNVWRDVVIPWSTLESVDADAGKYLRIEASGKWYEAYGAEKTNLSIITGRRGIAGAIADSFENLSDGHEDELNVKVTWRKPEAVELILVIIWLSYISLGLARVTF